MKQKEPKKTVYEVVNEYLNRQKEPEYAEIGIISYPDMNVFTFNNVTNLHEYTATAPMRIEFDSVHPKTGRNRHVVMNGEINRRITVLEDI